MKKDYIKRPRRIYYKSGKPYIIYKSKKYSISGTDPKTILKIINRLSKKYKRKTITKDKEDNKKNSVDKFLTGIITSKIMAGASTVEQDIKNKDTEQKINQINKTMLAIENKIDEDKKMISKVEDSNILKAIEYSKDNDITNLYKYDDKDKKYKFYITNDKFIPADSKEELNKILESSYNEYLSLQKELPKLQKTQEELNKKLNDTIEQKEEQMIQKLDITKKKFINENILKSQSVLKDKIEDTKTTKKKDKIGIEDYIKEQKLNRKDITTYLKRVEKDPISKNELIDYITNTQIKPKVEQEAEKIIINEPLPLGGLEKNSKEFSSLPEQGEGKSNKLDGLYDHEIDKIMSNTKYYLWTITKDEIDEIIKYIVDNKILKCCFIMNTANRYDNKNKYHHWVAFYMDFEDDMSLEYYDSYADPLDSKIKNKLQNMLEDLNINVYVKLKENKIKDQPLNSSLCGYYCIAFLLKRLNNVSFKSATNYKSLNEKNMKELKNKYEKFNFI